MANDRDIVIEAPADIVQRQNDADADDSLNPDEAPKRDLNIQQPELKQLIEEKIAKEENAEEKPEEKGVDADVDTHEGEDFGKKVVEEKKEEDIGEKVVEKKKEKDIEEKEKLKEKKDLEAKIKDAAAQKNDDQPALAPPMVRPSRISNEIIILYSDFYIHIFITDLNKC